MLETERVITVADYWANFSHYMKQMVFLPDGDISRGFAVRTVYRSAGGGYRVVYNDGKKRVTIEAKYWTKLVVLVPSSKFESTSE